MTLTEFLLARIAEDEAAAANSKADAATGKTLGIPPSWITGVADRVLAECKAKRRIVEFLRPDPSMPVDSGRFVAAGVLTLLAEPYAEHPDYNPDWRP